MTDHQYFNMISYINDKGVICYIKSLYKVDYSLPIVRIRGSDYVVKVHGDNEVINRKLFFKLMRLV